MIDQGKIDKCHDEIRFTITDRTGSLRFTKFEIVGVDACYDIEEALQSYLFNRPLDDVNIDDIRHALSGDHEECIRAIADIVEWFRPKTVGDIK